MYMSFAFLPLNKTSKGFYAKSFYVSYSKLSCELFLGLYPLKIEDFLRCLAMISEGSFCSSSDTAGDSILGLLEVTNAFRGSRSLES